MFWLGFQNLFLCVVYNLSTHIRHLGLSKHSAVFYHQVQDKTANRKYCLFCTVTSHLSFSITTTEYPVCLTTGILQIRVEHSSSTWVEQHRLMWNIIASYVTGAEQIPWEWKCMLAPLMKHLSANVDAGRCREAAQVPCAFLDTLL